MRFIARKIAQKLVRFRDEQAGVTTTEYAVLLAIIIIACIGAVLGTGDVQRALFFDTADIFSDAVEN